MRGKHLVTDEKELIAKETVNIKLYQKGGESFGPVFTEIKKRSEMVLLWTVCGTEILF